MKINRNEYIYIQEKDLQFIIDYNEYIPDFLEKMRHNKKIFNNPDNFLKFSDIDQINYLNSQDYILDYDTCINFSNDELYTYKFFIENEINSLMPLFLQLRDTIKKESREIFIKHKKMQYKQFSIEHFINWKNGYEQFQLPEEIYNHVR